MTDSLGHRLQELRSSVVYGIALASGWLTPAEKLYALKTARLWDEARSRDQTDLLMASGAYEEAIPRYAAFGHWRKVGDAQLAMGDVMAARASYERGENIPGKEYTAFRRGPDHDRLISLAISREDWPDVLRLIRLGEPDPLGNKDITFGGSSRAKGPLVKLCAHAAAATPDLLIAKEMRSFFGLNEAEVEVFIQHARAGGYTKDVAKLAKPPLLRVAARSLSQIMEEGSTDRSAAVASFLAALEPGFREAHQNMVSWLRTGGEEELSRVIFWLTRSGSFEVFKNCLFALQCETGLFFDPGPRHVAFYTSHPWITRASMRELLAALVAIGGSPTPEVLFSCVLQHSASIMPDIARGTFEIDRVDPLVAVRPHAVWAEAVIADWATGGMLDALWTMVMTEAAGKTWSDVRRMPPFAELCDTIAAELILAWKRDMDAIRWKAEESAFLSLQALLPGVPLERHAMPSWLAPQHLDIFVPGAGVAIEYQGEQHYRPIELFGGKAGFAATIRRDENKRQLCLLAGVTLEYIRFDEDASQRIREIARLCQANGRQGPR